VAPVAVATRDRLLDEAERLFARGGVQGVTTREITEAAEQRNTSAVTYHFRSRQGLLLEILVRRGGPIDDERGRLRSLLGPEPAVRELVACLVRPYADLLNSEPGRSYLRIVAQLRGRFAAWRLESDAATTVHLAAVLDEIERRPAAPAAIRRERVLALIILLTGSTAERARRLDADDPVELTHQAYADNLIDLCTALVSA
jgi:AcrR family transcriptional regulator